MDFPQWRSPEPGVTALTVSRGTLCTTTITTKKIHQDFFSCDFQLKLDGDSKSAKLLGVQDDNEYQISLSALYGDGAQSEAVAIRYSTSELSLFFLKFFHIC